MVNLGDYWNIFSVKTFTVSTEKLLQIMFFWIIFLDTFFESFTGKYLCV